MIEEEEELMATAEDLFRLVDALAARGSSSLSDSSLGEAPLDIEEGWVWLDEDCLAVVLGPFSEPSLSANRYGH